MFELIPFDRSNRSIFSYNPFRDIEDLERAFWSGGRSGGFKTDIKDTNNAYILEADLPGFRKEDISVDIENDYLTIKAERSSENEDKNENGNYIRRERNYGVYSRSFDVSSVKVDEISAEYKDGVLTLNMPKKESVIPASRRLEIN